MSFEHLVRCAQALGLDYEVVDGELFIISCDDDGNTHHTLYDPMIFDHQMLELMLKLRPAIVRSVQVYGPDGEIRPGWAVGDHTNLRTHQRLHAAVVEYFGTRLETPTQPGTQYAH